MSLTWLLLILAIALFVLGAVRFDLVLARWRELMGAPQIVRHAPPVEAVVERPPHNIGPQPQAARVNKPGFHRSGRRH
ncbi:MAG: hypothetical protein EOP35_05615 [Rubrivivax sp.]|nr:MAG: hypothetical protein EOP35_05615 [Rubrivivax sp.]